ncbi:MAG: sodium/proline symporter [bacterium LCO1.1]|uniref:Sodium/proline symporter n=1 Tax=Candidatus Weimeria bifida TaxID=2599074 RepID=A0A6N7IZU1_9FIRM|nr:sodium/proline symporter [Candidatus Weimeria bifida]
MSTAQIGMFVTMVVYLVAMLLMGAAVANRNKTVGDFYIGGRHLGPLVTAMSAEASDMSSYLLMGIPGLAYLSGIADAGWTIIGLAAGTYINWLVTAKRIRRYTEATGSITVPAFFSDRYGDKKNILTFIAAVIIIVFFVPYTASGFAGCGKLFAILFNTNYHTAMIGSAVVIIAYTMLGGFLAASTTDFVQSIVMSAALIIVLVFETMSAGGASAVIGNARGLAGYFSMLHTHNAVTGKAEPYDIVRIISTLAWGLGYFGMPHILLRFMAIEDEKKLSLSRRVATIWVLISMAVSVCIGISGLAMSSNGLIPQLKGSDSETVIIKVSNLLAGHGTIFAVIAGIVLSGILASTMSTADSQLLCASSSVTSDILTKCLHTKIPEKKLMTISRLALVGIGVLGVFLAWNPNSSVFQIVSFAWAGFGGTFGPVMLLALFWKRSNRNGALAGMVSGGIMIFVWKFLVRPLGGAFDIYELLPAFLTALAFDVIVSLLTKAPDKEITDVFEKVGA